MTDPLPNPAAFDDGGPDAAAPSEAAAAAALPAERAMPSSQPVLMRALRWGGISTAVLLVLCGGVGYLIAAGPGLVGGVLGAAFAGFFLGLTVGSIAFANRFIQSELYVPLFFAIVLGTWILKFVIFIVIALLLRDQPWLNPKVLFGSLVLGVIVSLVLDVLVVVKSRLPYVSDPAA